MGYTLTCNIMYLLKVWNQEYEINLSLFCTLNLNINLFQYYKINKIYLKIIKLYL